MAKKLWGGRFKEKTDPEFFEFQKSIKDDYKLATYDILHSLIHITALEKSGILSKTEKSKLEFALLRVKKKISEEINNKQFKPKDSEDIHTEIQNRVEKELGRKYGALVLKLHTLRSRNDQISFDLRCYCAQKSLNIYFYLLHLVKGLLELCIEAAKKKQEFIGYTHTRRAQVIPFAYYLDAYKDMFERDLNRTKKYHDEIFIYIGAGALAGSSLSSSAYNAGIKEQIREIMLGVLEQPQIYEKIRLSGNPLDNVSDRDFIIQFLSILSILQMHFSRLAEDLILYSTKEFDLIALPEEFCTGSSLMPHKKNPDLLELIRGNTGKIYGNLVSILTTMKSLPLTYDRDMQLDKEPLFSSVETVEAELRILAKFIKKVKLRTETVDAIKKQDISLYATEIAEELVRKNGVPFKKAHDIVGRFITLLEKNGGNLDNIKDLKHKCSGINKKMIEKIMKPGYVVSLRKSFSRKIK